MQKYRVQFFHTDGGTTSANIYPVTAIIPLLSRALPFFSPKSVLQPSDSLTISRTTVLPEAPSYHRAKE
jgi:hypothetical protein